MSGTKYGLVAKSAGLRPALFFTYLRMFASPPQTEIGLTDSMAADKFL